MEFLTFALAQFCANALSVVLLVCGAPLWLGLSVLTIPALLLGAAWAIHTIRRG